LFCRNHHFFLEHFLAALTALSLRFRFALALFRLTGALEKAGNARKRMSNAFC